MSLMWTIFVPPLIVISALFYGGILWWCAQHIESYHYRRKQKARR